MRFGKLGSTPVFVLLVVLQCRTGPATLQTPSVVPPLGSVARFPAPLSGGTLIASALVGANVMVELSPESADQTVWTASAVYRTQTSGDYHQTVLADYVSWVYAKNPKADPDAVVRTLNGIEDEFRRQRAKADALPPSPSAEDVMNLGVAAVEAVAGRNAKPLFKEIPKWGIKAYEAIEGPAARIAAQKQLASVDSSVEYQQSTWEAAWQLAHVNPNAAKVIDTYFKRFLNGVESHDSAQTIRSKNPSFIDHEVLSLLNAGRLSVPKKGLETILARRMDVLKSAAARQLEELKKIDAQQTSLLQYASEQRNRASREAEERQAAALRRLELEATRSGIYVLSKLVGTADPIAGRAVATLGNAGLQLAESLDAYAHASRTFGGGVGTSLGSIVLTGNILNIGLGIASLLGSSGPTADALILQGIGDLKKQIGELSQKMHGRFDRIDRTLNAIYVTFAQRLGALESQLAAAHRDVLGIRQDLIELEKRSYRLERNILEAVRAGFDRNLEDSATLCLESGELFVRADLSPDDYKRCVVAFMNYSIKHSHDKLAVRKAEYTDRRHVAEAIGEVPLAEQLFYLDSLATRRWGVHLAGDVPTLANPIQWAAGADLFMTLADTYWDGHFSKATSVEPTNRILAMGERLNRYVASLTARRAAPSPSPSPVERSVVDYADAVESIAALIDDMRKKYEDANMNGAPLWGVQSTSQALHAILPCPGADLSGGVSGPLAPNGPMQELFENEMARADAMKLGASLVCYMRAGWLDQQPQNGNATIDAAGTGGPPCSWHHDELRATLGVDIEGRVGPVPVFQARYRGSEELVRQTTTFGGDCSNCQGCNNSSQPYRDANALISNGWPMIAAGLSIGNARADLSKRIADHIATHHEAFRRQLIQATQQKGAPLQRALEELDGARVAMVSFLEVGLERTLTEDDYLRVLLVGEERVADSAILINAIAVAEANLEGFGVSVIARRRADALASRVRAAVELPAPRRFGIVSSTMRRLELWKARQSQQKPGRSGQ